MRKVITFLGASIGMTLAVAAMAQDPKAPDMFKDVDTSHWAYQAVESLRAKDIIVGYPDGYFRGKRTLTRYEFAVALDRALRKLPAGTKGADGAPGATGAQGQPGEKGQQGDKGETGLPGMTPEEVAAFKRLLDEFKTELAALGNSVAGINRKVDGLSKDVAALKTRLDNMPVFYGGASLGIRSDRANGFYVDKDGRFMASAGAGSLVNTPLVVHEFLLGVKANIPGGAKLDAALITGNYKNTEGSLALVGGGYNTNANSDTYIRNLEITAPFSGFGKGSQLTLGRFAYNIGHFTLWRPVVDTYLQDPLLETGKYYIDGVKLNTKLGSVMLEAVGAQTKSVMGANGGPINSPAAGASFANLFSAGFKPAGQVGQGQMQVDELAAINASVGVNVLGKEGHIRATALGTANTGTGFSGSGFTNVLVLGSDFDLGVSEHIKLTGDFAKSITGTGQFNTVGPYQNNAYNGAFAFASGGLNISAGYRYIDPLFYTPGYWGRIGNWVNPTNIQGPTFRANYNFAPTFGANIGGDFFSAARNRALSGGLSTDDEINRVLLGLRWDVSKNFRTTVDWEGVYWKLSGAHSGIPAVGAGAVHPTEQYITLGTGYNLTSSTLLKLSYQIGDFNGHGVLNGGAGNVSNYNSFTGNVSVKF